jgi:hypothetical protein
LFASRSQGLGSESDTGCEGRRAGRARLASIPQYKLRFPFGAISPKLFVPVVHGMLHLSSKSAQHGPPGHLHPTWPTVGFPTKLIFRASERQKREITARSPVHVASGLNECSEFTLDLLTTAGSHRPLSGSTVPVAESPRRPRRVVGTPLCRPDPAERAACPGSQGPQRAGTAQ